MSGEYTIRVVSSEAVRLFGEMAVHHSIVFFDGDNVPQVLFSGEAMDYKTGKLARDLKRLGTENDTLRVFSGHIKDDYSDSFKKDFVDGDISNIVFTGSKAEVFEKMLLMMDAANHINQQNLQYQIVGVVAESQNSNSVANSLLTAANIEIPPEVSNLWAPGFDRILLPENWKSAYANQDIALRDLKTLLKSAIPLIGPEAVAEMVKNDGELPGAHDRIYDREEPRVPYNPIGKVNVDGTSNATPSYRNPPNNVDIPRYNGP